MSLADRARAYMGGEPLMPIAALFALNAVDELDTALFTTLGPEIADGFGVGVGVFGAITILVTILVPLISVPVAHLADRRDRMPLAIAGAAAWGTFSLATGLAPVLLVLVAFRVGSGFGKVVNEPVHAGLIADFYSPSARVKAYGVHSLANPFGVGVSAVLGGVIAELTNWRVAFLCLAVPTFVVLLFARRVPEPPRGRHETVAITEVPPIGETAARLWAVRSLRNQYIGLAFCAGSILGISVLVPFFLEDEFGVGPFARGLIIGTGTALSAVFVLIGTRSMQQSFVRSPADSLRTVAKAGVVAGVCLFVAAGAPALWLVTLMIWAVMCVFAFVAPGLRAVVTAVAPPDIRSSAFAFAGLVALAGSGFAVIGFAIGNSNTRLAIALMAPIFLRGIGYFFKAAERVDDDIARSRQLPAPAGEGQAPASDALLEVRGLTASYDRVQVLFGVDLEVAPGEIVALLGTNGAGKSTTLNAISGLHEPDSGNVWFDGEPIVGLAPERTVPRGIVQVPGGRGVFPSLTVAENLEMGSFVLRRDRQLVRARLDDVLDLFPRLAERRGQRAGSLSGGERQMLTLAQSFLLRPRLLLIDELSLGLAPAVVEELFEAVRVLNQQGVSMVLVEQSVNLALTLADRAYFMEKGEVRFTGPTADLLARPDILRSVFLEGVRKP
jgi:ABC-type branched-subunit amino acid transport system ATPase component/MFS family permease